jgi:DNA-binding NarL/FixJ family response regulator
MSPDPPAPAAPDGRPVRILLVDDQELVRRGLRMVLEEEPDLEIVGEAGDGAEAVRAAARVHPDVVVMDVRMPGTDGVEATRLITASGPARVLILTTFDLDEYVLAALRAGADGFLLKDTLTADLIQSIRTVHNGDAIIAPATTRRLIQHFIRRPTPAPADLARLDRLTPRERDVFELIGQGQSNAEIAAALFLSEGTVKTHVSRVLTKLDLRDRVQAVVLAHQLGITEPAD